MREVFVHQDSARVGLYKSILDANGIPNFVRNGLSNNSVTDLPSGVFFPTLCVMDGADYERAVEILRHVHKPDPSDSPDWTCASCGEEVPGTFDLCWKCGANRSERAPVSTGVGNPPSVELHGNLGKMAAPESVSGIANIFRWLVLVNVLLGLLGLVLCSQLERDPPFALKPWMEEQNGIPDWLRNIASVAWSVRLTLWGFSQFLCFMLWNPGRLCLMLEVVCDTLIIGVFSGGLFPPWVSLVWYFQDLIMGALLALMWLSPLRERFSFKGQGR